MKDSLNGKLQVLLTGLPGSGKTTIAHKISEEYGVYMIKSGELLREMSQGDDEIAKKLQAVMQAGDYADDDLVIEVIKKAMQSEECANGFVTDGYPRRLSQLKTFDPGFNVVFYLEVAEAVAVKRLENRHRADDTPEIIKRRLKVFEEEMLPLLQYFREQGRLVTINAEHDVEGVYKQVKEFIDDTQNS